jgi:nucleotide-binding universal stress UspA family protein
MAKKILALVSEPISGEALKKVVEADDAEVMVVAPALNSKTRFWMSDTDGAIEQAQEVADETAERMEAEGVDAVGDTGESDPLLALQDALATFDADEIVICVHPEGERNWLEDGLVEDARERFGEGRVRHLLIS